MGSVSTFASLEGVGRNRDCYLQGVYLLSNQQRHLELCMYDCHVEFEEYMKCRSNPTKNISK